MVAYLLLLVAVLSRVIPHAGWWNFTAVTGGLLYFGSRRPWREMLVPLAALMATDFFLTIAVYHYSFLWQGYVITWIWYVAAMALGSILLRKQTTFARGVAATLLGPTGFFLVLELRRLGQRLQRLSAEPRWTRSLLYCRAAVLSQ